MTGIDVKYVETCLLRTGNGDELRIEEMLTVCPREVVEGLSLAGLRKAGADLWKRDLVMLELWIAEVPNDDFNPELVRFSDMSDIRVVVDDELTIVLPTGHLAVDGPDAWAWVSDVLQPLLRRHGARLVSVDVDFADASDETIVATIEPRWRGKTVSDALHLGEEALALIRAMDGGHLDLASAADLIRAGHASVLIDQAEGSWLDGKAAPYRLATDGEKLEFAKDIASFANASSGGLILIGARTESTADGDIIRRVRDIPLSQINVPQMRGIVAGRIFPAIDGLEIRRIDHGEDRGVVLIYVPPQRVSRTPFLVRGTQVETKTRSTFFGVPERVGSRR